MLEKDLFAKNEYTLTVEGQLEDVNEELNKMTKDKESLQKQYEQMEAKLIEKNREMEAKLMEKSREMEERQEMQETPTFLTHAEVQ